MGSFGEEVSAVEGGKNEIISRVDFIHVKAGNIELVEV